MTTTDINIDDDLVRQAAFHHLEDEVWDLVTDDAHIEQLYERARSIERKIQAQLEAFNANLAVDGEGDLQWRRKAMAVKTKTAGLVAHLTPKIKEMRRRSAAGQWEARYIQLRQAVHAHHDQVDRDYEPTVADLTLWEAVDEIEDTRLASERSVN